MFKNRWVKVNVFGIEKTDRSKTGEKIQHGNGKSMGYTKLFSSIIASSVWREDLATKVVWVTMLALKNERHVVEASMSGLAHLAGVNIEQCQSAIAKFLAPDPESRSTANDGRKIERCEGGWLILNGEHYKRLLNKDERREYQRVKQAQYRREKKLKRTQAMVRAQNDSRENRFCEALDRGDDVAADQIVAEGLVKGGLSDIP